MPAQPIVTNYNLQQIFLGKNFGDTRLCTNGTGAAITIQPGTLMGTILTNGQTYPTVSTATDGSEYPDAIYADAAVTIPAGQTVSLYVAKGGNVNQNAVTFFNGTDLWTTAVGAAATGGGTMQRVLERNATGIKLWPSIEITRTDPNQ